MNILFLSIGSFESIESHAIYPDLLRKFRDKGHIIYSVSSYERKLGKHTELEKGKGYYSLHVRIGNITKCNLIEKGLSTLLIECQYKNAIKRYFPKVKFDLILYSTPPITLVGVVNYIKERDKATTYLLLKDIFPQNAIDIGIINKRGLKGILYRYFRKKEKKLYKVSDYIGCMSQANVDYILKHNPEIPIKRVEVCPNCVEPRDLSCSYSERTVIRNKYNIPVDKIVFVYGGSLGKPQGIPFLIKCLNRQKNNKKAFFLIVGSGTYFEKIKRFLETKKTKNVKLLEKLPKEEYNKLVAACDVGMIFLDHRFTIPNFPSRLLSYMQAKLPVLAVTDPNTDIGKTIVEGGFGWWCESSRVNDFSELVMQAIESDKASLGEKAYDYLLSNYTSEIGYKIICNSVEDIT